MVSTASPGLRGPANFPALHEIRAMTPEQRRKPLAAWVTWLNANRSEVDPSLAQEIDRAVTDLLEDRKPVVDLHDLHDRLDGWLEDAGEPGAGQRSM